MPVNTTRYHRPMRALLLATFLLTTPAFADDTAFLVLEEDAGKLVAGINAGLESNDALTRATAARVATVRAVADVVPQLSARLATESDAVAARELIRGIAILGGESYADQLMAASARFPAGMDAALADAYARRGAIDLYFSKLRELRSTGDFFETALWGRPQLYTVTAAKLVGRGDEAGLRSFFATMREAKIDVDANVLSAALDAQTETTRTVAVWHVVMAYAGQGERVPQRMREVMLAAHTETGSDREEYGRELARRILGEEPRSNPRWIAWLATPEADELLGRVPEALDALYTREERRVREQRCKNTSMRCPAPSSSTRVFPSYAVEPADFILPANLPRGLAARIIEATKCRAEWIGVATAQVDAQGRVRTLNLGELAPKGTCERALRTMMLLTLVDNRSLASRRATPNVVYVRPARAVPCVDESLPSTTVGLHRGGGEVQVPLVRTRVEPKFPEGVRAEMGGNSAVVTVLEAVITREGCVSAIYPLKQSQWG